MVALINVGSIGAPVNGLATTPLDVSTNDTFVSGVDEITVAQGSVQPVNLGKDEIPPQSTPNHSACGGNACNLTGISDTFAAAMDSFSTSWTSGVYKTGHSAPAGSLSLDASYFTSVTNLSQLIAVLDTQMELATGGVDVGGGGVAYHSAGALTIVSNFLSNLGSTTLTAIVGTPGEKTTVQFTGLTDIDAADIDRFTLSLDGTPLDTSGINFAAITTRAQLATALDALPGIDVTQNTGSGGTLVVTASTNGDTTFTNISLVDITQYETKSTASFGFTAAEGGLTALNAAVAAAEDFSIKLGGADVNFSLNAASFTDAATLAAALNAHSSVSAQVVTDGAGARIVLTAANAGSATTFTGLELVDNEAGPPTKATSTITGVDASAGEVDAFSISVDGAAVDTSSVQFDLATDGATLAAELDKLPGIAVTYSAAAGGTLTITAETAGAAVFSNVTLQKLNELVGDGGDNTLTGDATGTLILGLGGHDILTGDSGVDELHGGTGRDTLDGRGNADLMLGGDGDDTYTVDNAGDSIAENAGEGTDTVRTTLTSFTLGANFENLEFIGSGAFTGTGNGLNNRITGGSGHDILDGLGGADTLVGGLGDDTYQADGAGDVILEKAGEGSDLVRTSLASFQLGAHLENLEFTGVGAFSGLGNSEANRVTGGDSNDVLNGRGGADTMIGGKGDDTYRVDDAGDIVTEAVAEGVDTVRTGLASRTLSANVENLLFTGSGAFQGTGNGLANIITGGAGGDRLIGQDGNDTLDGRGGNDFLFGGVGNDTLNGKSDNDTLEGGVDNDTLNGGGGVDTLLGQSGNDTLNGDGGDDILKGHNGADTLDGGLGNDTLTGGADRDEIIGGKGQDKLRGGTENDKLFGGVGADTLRGQDGNDQLSGQAGNDILTGGAGSDLFIFDGGKDRIKDFADDTDTVRLDTTALGLGGMSKKQVLALASVDGSDIVFNFGSGNKLWLEGITDISALSNDLGLL